MGLAKNHTIFRTHVVGNKDVVSVFGWLVAFRTAAVKEASLGSSSTALKSSIQHLLHLKHGLMVYFNLTTTEVLDLDIRFMHLNWHLAEHLRHSEVNHHPQGWPSGQKSTSATSGNQGFLLWAPKVCPDFRGGAKKQPVPWHGGTG